MNSTTFPVTFEYPSSWKKYSDISNAQVTLPYERIVGENELVIDDNNCAVYLGFGGGEGPTSEITNESVVIDEKPFVKRSWHSDGQPIFISYLTQTRIEKFEMLLAWISEQESAECQKTIDQILSTFKFVE